MIKPQQIYQLSKNLSDKVPELLDALGIQYTVNNDIYSFACPVHGGDNAVGCSIFADGAPNWSCWTHSCHEKYKKTLFGFVRGVLSYRREKAETMNGTVKFCMNFLNCELDDLPAIPVNAVVKQQSKIYDVFNLKPERSVFKMDRTYVLNTLSIPSKYYMGRGYSPDTLKRFDVGDCLSEGKAMSNRAVVPIYDEDFNFVGCSGRTLIDEIPKWRHSKDLNKTQFLYGLNVAKQRIMDTASVILVESPGNVWRLYEAGYSYAVGMFGANLSDEQLILLEKSGSLNLYILMDNDAAGWKAVEQIKNKCGRRFNITAVSIPGEYNDVGEMSIEDIKELLGEINE